MLPLDHVPMKAVGGKDDSILLLLEFTASFCVFILNEAVSRILKAFSLGVTFDLIFNRI